MTTNTPPLHTNHTKKIVFVFAFLASSFFNIALFSSIGGNLAIRIIWGLVGLSAVFFQTVELRNFFNIKRKIKYLHLTAYIVCTIGSIAGTLGAGYSQIEKSRPTIKQIEITKSENAIDKVFNSKRELNQWALINLLNKKSKLAEQKINIVKKEKGISSSLTGIANIFNVSHELVAFYFLIFVAVILELMVFGSATFTGKLINGKFALSKSSNKTKPKRLSKFEKEIKAGQQVMKMKVG